jgi:hypothetical protein
MLTEVALTPHTFQVCATQPAEWANQLRALNQRLLYYGGQCPLIFSNLNTNSAYRTPAWHAEVRRIVGAAPKQHRQLVADLLQRIEEHLVTRPSHGQVRVTGEELHWVREAIAPGPGFPIDQVVVTLAGQPAARGLRADAVCVNRLDREPFWGAITVCAFPSMDITRQVQLLGPIWLHAQVLAVVLPYGLDTSRTGEANWFFTFASRAFGRPAEHGEPVIELHASFDGNGADMKAQGVAYAQVANWLDEARQQAGLRGHEFSLVVRARSHGSQRFIARRLFAGERVNVGTGVPDVRVRWGVALEHVALRTDAPTQTPPTFTLLPRQQADSQFRFECRSVGPRLLGPIPVRC